MLKDTTVATEIYKFSVNYSIEMKKNENGEYDYVKFLFEDLLEEGFDDNDFLIAIKTIKRENPNMYGKMPNIAMFIEARPPKQYRSTTPEHKLICDEKPKMLEKPITREEIEAYRKKIKETLETIAPMLRKPASGIMNWFLEDMENKFRRQNEKTN